MKYVRALKKNRFVDALSSCPIFFRYILSRQLWMANRLGLYKTVLQQKIVLPHKRNFVVQTIAKIKRYRITDEEAIKYLRVILSNKKYINLRLELIKETAYFFPDFYIKYFSENPEYLENQYILGMFLSMLHLSSNENRQALGNKYIDKLTDNLNNDCLIHNFQHTDSISRVEMLNKWFAVYGLNQIGLIDEKEKFNVANIYSEGNNLPYNKKYKVSVVITSYNSGNTIESCVNSLLSQTFTNIEVIVVDDNSEDNSLDIIQRLSKKDNRIIVLQLPKNVGTFAAKSIASEYASGDFLTCQDSDDWAHPQKIEEQVRPLIENEQLIATTSYWLRIDDDGEFFTRKYYPFFTQNPASPMFRLNKVKEDIGLWHIVRTGADSEFYERLQLYYGKESIKVIKKPLTLASHRLDSLMTSPEFGTFTKKSACNRLDYWESWRLWHIKKKSIGQNIFIPNAYKQLEEDLELFKVPNPIKVNIKDLEYVINNVISTE